MRDTTETKAFLTDLAAAINRNSAEGGSDTPDFVLAEYLQGCLKAFDDAVRQREEWHSHDYHPATEDRRGVITSDAAEMITAAVDEQTLLTWMGSVDHTAVTHSWAFGKQIHLNFAMTGLDPHGHLETAPYIHVVLGRDNAKALIGKIQDALAEQAHKGGEDCGVRSCGPCSFERARAYDEAVKRHTSQENNDA